MLVTGTWFSVSTKLFSISCPLRFLMIRIRLLYIIKKEKNKEIGLVFVKKNLIYEKKMVK